jgi:hypothetical protein
MEGHIGRQQPEIQRYSHSQLDSLSLLSRDRQDLTYRTSRDIAAFDEEAGRKTIPLDQEIVKP